MKSIIKGTLLDIKYTADNMWRVLGIETATGDYVEAVGIHPHAVIGEELSLHGQWTDHVEWARKFVFERLDANPPSDAQELVRYIVSQADIDHALAHQIVNKFGQRTLEILNRYPDKLHQLEGIGSATIKRIQEQWVSHRVANQTNELISELGLPDWLAQKLIDSVGGGTDTAYHKLKHNPYLAYLLLPDDVNFFAVDRKALDDKGSTTSLNRIQAGVLYTLHRAALNGHTYLPLSALPKYLEKYIKVQTSDSDEILQSALNQLHNEEYVQIKSGKLFLPDLKKYEYQLCAHLMRLAEGEQDFEIPSPQMLKKILSDILHTALNEDEFDTIVFILTQKLSHIHWPNWLPIDRIIQAVNSVLSELMISLTVIGAGLSLHQRLSTLLPDVNILLVDDCITSKETDIDLAKALADTSLVIIANAEQINLKQFNFILKNIPDSTSVCLLGDLQAPCKLGPGQVFHTIAKYSKLPTLHEEWLPSEDIPISEFDHLIQQEDKNTALSGIESLNKPLCNIKCSGVDKMHDLIMHLAKKGLGLLGAKDHQEVIVLTPSRQTQLKIDQLNANLCNYYQNSGISYRFGHLELNAKTPLVTTSAVPGLPEGTRVFVEKVDSNGHLIVKSGEKIVSLPRRYASRLEIAYVLPVYNALNMRVPLVFLMIPDKQAFLAHRRLFYAAACIATHKLIILSSKALLIRNIDRELKGIYEQLPELLESNNNELSE